jgi:hypothetical protein
MEKIDVVALSEQRTKQKENLQGFQLCIFHHNKNPKLDWKCGSSNRAPALQT